ncbi:unnamed protein product [Nezara viridula]|uniref:Uncharacterized protein n=1 Tax=Nezara viridula TaxID=85310 RepID=A0A9P0H5B1_NEZVI|nr:unnamed protein product [Nezara viridula]
MIGFGSDGASVMVGRHNSVSSRLKEACPGIVTINCICHSLHICANEACKCLPRHVEDLARNIYTFINDSSKRISQFQQFQNFVGVKIHKMLHPSQTRWLSLQEVVDRIVEQWDALKLFFTDRLKTATVGGLVQASEYIKSHGGCINFAPTSEMRALMANANFQVSEERDFAGTLGVVQTQGIY